MRGPDQLQRRLVVISDIHSNADMLDLALDKATKAAPDLIVILGDLLTYGAQPNSVLKALDDCVLGPIPVVLISGNHDEFYFNLERGRPDIFTNEPQFTQTSVHWTNAQISGQLPLSARYEWQKSYTFGPIFLSHANPFEYGDWTYVSSSEARLLAAAILRAKRFKIGVFGHSHRASHIVVCPNGINTFSQREWIDLSPDQTMILNPGTVGHPRGTGLSFLVLDVAGSRARVDIVQLAADHEVQKHAITMADLPASTKLKLLSYFE